VSGLVLSFVWFFDFFGGLFACRGGGIYLSPIVTYVVPKGQGLIILLINLLYALLLFRPICVYQLMLFRSLRPFQEDLSLLSHQDSRLVFLATYFYPPTPLPPTERTHDPTRLRPHFFQWPKTCLSQNHPKFFSLLP